MEVHPGALNIMRFHAERGSKARWAAYRSPRNALVFLSIDPDGRHKELPEQHPAGAGYRFVGWVDLETGEVEEVKCRG